jgi:HSP20 family protein
MGSAGRGIPGALLVDGGAVGEGEAEGVVVDQGVGLGGVPRREAGLLQLRQKRLGQGQGVQAERVAGLEQGRDAGMVFQVRAEPVGEGLDLPGPAGSVADLGVDLGQHPVCGQVAELLLAAPAISCGGFGKVASLEFDCERRAQYSEQCYSEANVVHSNCIFSRVRQGACPARRMRENDMTVMTSWDLFDDLRNAQDELARLSRMPGHWIGQFGQQPSTSPAAQAWAPAVDITEHKDAYLVAADMPGVGTDDLKITFQDGLLTIQGERHPAAEAAGDKVHRSERRYGAFRRTLTLPSHVQADKIQASAQDGVLMILVPKAPEAHAQRIQVRAGKVKPLVAGTAVKNDA